jgi:hypothetical protein
MQRLRLGVRFAAEGGVKNPLRDDPAQGRIDL